MHAKMTRDRKKSFIAAIEKTIEELESSNKRMGAILAEVVHSQKPSTQVDVLVSSGNHKIDDNASKTIHPHGVTPSSSPATIPRETWANSVPELMPVLPISFTKKNAIHTIMTPTDRKTSDDVSTELHLPPKKRVCHGFSLPY